MKKLIVILMLFGPVFMFGQTIMKADTLYKVERLNYAGNTGSTGALLLYGDSIRVNILGSQILPDSSNAMVNIYRLILPAQDTSMIDTCGAYSFQILPNFIYFNGAVDSVEIVGYRVLQNYGFFD